MSATSSPLRRPRLCTASASTASPATAARTAAMSGLPGQAMSTASPAESATAVPPRTASRTRWMVAGCSVVAARAATSVTIWGMVAAAWHQAA